MRRRVSGALAVLLAGVLFVGLRLPVTAYYFTPCQSNGAPCPWRNPTDIYVGVYGQGVPPYLMNATGQALSGWNGATAMGFVWEDRSDYNAQIIVVPYWKNWIGAFSSVDPNGTANAIGGCRAYDSSGQWCTHGEVDLNLDNSTSGSWLMLDQDASIRALQTNSIEHEVGHVIGLAHSCVNAQNHVRAELPAQLRELLQLRAGPAAKLPNNSPA